MAVRNTRTVATVVALLTATAFIAAACQPASAPWTSDVPSGHLDAVTLDSTGTRLSVRGWAGDRNTTAPIDVVVFVDGRLQPGAHRADKPRPDVAAQTGRGARSGFDVTITVTGRTSADVCVSAVNVGPGDHALLGCVRNVTPQSAPAPKPTTTTTPPSLAMSYPSGKFAPDAGSTVSPKVLNATGPVRFTVTSGELPAGVSFDSNTGVFTGLATWPTEMVTVSNGSAHSCSVDTRGAAWCWGSNMSGQLGDGTNNRSNVPVPVVGLSSGVGAISAGASHSCAVVSGAVKRWGSNRSGQLGNGTDNDSNVPVPVVGLGSGASAVAGGDSHSCAVVSGIMKCWGANHLGQLGDGTNNRSNVPVPVDGLGSGVSSVSTGTLHSCAVVSGAARCWGYNNEGELGDGTNNNSNVPVPVVGLGSGVSSVSAGGYHSCAVVSGAARCWGYNNEEQLGIGTNNDSNVPVPVVGLGSGVSSVSAGGYHSCAVTSDGVSCWGNNYSGQLGDGNNNDSNVPVSVSGLGSRVNTVAAGGVHSCAVVSGVVKCWGSNGAGQLGDGTDNNSNVPHDVFGTTPAPGFPATITVKSTNGARTATATVTLTAP